MIKTEVEFEGNELVVNGYTIEILYYFDSGLFYQIQNVPVTSGGIHYSLSEAVKYCMGN